MKDDRYLPHPAMASALILLISVAGIALTVQNGPFSMHLEDRDNDGISDIYQDIRPREDLVLTADGGWKVVQTGYESAPDLPFIAFVGILGLIVFPLIGYLLLDSRRKESEFDEVPRMYDAVRRLSSFMEINPSLLNSIRLTVRSIPEGVQHPLKDLMWRARASSSTFGDLFSEFAGEWEGREPSIGKALRTLASAERESDRSDSVRKARMAVDDLSREAKETMGRYSNSLSGPSSALFALGVLLPVLLATVYPLVGSGGKSMWIVAFFLWFVLPGGIMYIGMGLVKRRPRFWVRAKSRSAFRPRAIPGGVVPASAGTLIITAYLLGALPELPIGISDKLLRPILLLLGISLLFSGLLRMIAPTDAKCDELSALPEAMESIGSSVSEGLPFERALLSANMFQEEKRDGMTGTFLEAASHFSRAGAVSGGGAIKALASHLKEIRSLEEEMSQKVSAAIGQMVVTATVLGPVMLGSSLGIYRLLDESAGLGGSDTGPIGGPSLGGNGVDISAFLVIVGIYLMLLAVTTTLISHRLSRGRLDGGWGGVPSKIMISTLAFSAGVILTDLLV